MRDVEACKDNAAHLLPPMIHLNTSGIVISLWVIASLRSSRVLLRFPWVGGVFTNAGLLYIIGCPPLSRSARTSSK